MSGRQLRRLREQQEQEPSVPVSPPSTSSANESGSDEDDQAPSNPFALLQGSDSDDVGGSGGSTEDEEEEAGPGVGPSPAPATKPARKRQGKPVARGEEDIDAVLAALGMTPPAPGAGLHTPAVTSAAAAGGSGRASSAKPLLAVNMRALKAGDELKRMFGAEAMRGDDDSDAAAVFAGASRRVRRLAARGLLRTAKLRPGLIIDPGDHWPSFDGGFSMEVSGPVGAQTFNYVYSAGYMAIQALYERCQASHDPNAVAAILHTVPYHLDTLLTMYDLNRSMGENAAADEMLQRCLYALEMAWHPFFSPATANCHVPYTEPNLPLFTALFQYAQGLSRRGLHKTALEVTKLLLGLNGEDPAGALLCIDYFATRAGQPGLVLRLLEGGTRDGATLALLPNWAFSGALARRSLALDSGSNPAPGPGAAQEADDALAAAILSFPAAVPALVGRVEGSGARTPAWAQTLARPLFSAAANDSATLDHLISIFVERQHLLWKPPATLEWLRAQCERVATAPPTLGGVAPGDWAEAVGAAYPPCHVSAYRGTLRTPDFSDAVQPLPPEEVRGHAGGGGGGLLEGLPPEMEAELAAMQADEARGGEGVGPVPAEELARAGTLRTLLRSLLPWLNFGEQPDYEEEEGEEARQGGA